MYGSSCQDASCAAEIRGNLIAENSTDNFVRGGGVHVDGGGSVRIIGNVILNNSAPFQGAGIAISAAIDVQIVNNLIVGNQVIHANGQGGGIYWNMNSGASGPFVVGNTLVDNLAAHGSGVYADGYDAQALIGNNMIRGVPGVTGIECAASGDALAPIVRGNNVYVENAAPYAGLCESADGTDGNTSEAPVFAGIDDYRLAPGSPGIDAGDNAFATESVDLQGLPRIADGDGDGVAIVDQGAYELPPDSVFSDGFDPR